MIAFAFRTCSGKLSFVYHHLLARSWGWVGGKGGQGRQSSGARDGDGDGMGKPMYYCKIGLTSSSISPRFHFFLLEGLWFGRK